MQYLTDYSGIDKAVGKLGFAATFGTILLLIARIVDIIDDPLQAWLIDNAKEGRLGKYRKFAFANIILVTVAVICVFSIPAVVKSNAVLLCVWVGFFYLLYELGEAFNTAMPLMQKLSYDTKLRTKWTLHMRIWLIVIMVPVYFFIPIVTIADKSIGNLGKSFSMVTVVMMVVLGVIAFIGLLGLKEKPLNSGASEAQDDKLKMSEVLQMFKKNKPLLVHTTAYLLSNLVFGLSTAISVYFLKWYYAADLTTGFVDADKYASIYGIYAIAGLLPNFIAPFISKSVIAKFKTYAKSANACLLLGVVLYAIWAVMFFSGALKGSPYLFTLFNLLSGFITGTAVMPQTLLWTECADYAEYKTGRKMSAMVNSVSNIIGKAQAALSSALIGGVLIWVGYSVNSETGHYSGDLTTLPGMINGFGVFLTIVPAVIMLAAFLLYKFLYPITPEIQKQMTDTLKAKTKQN
jgi:Na+/melibiose symporter-like transporter